VQASYLLTYRADDAGFRRRNLETILVWLSTLACREALEVIVVEQSPVPTLPRDGLDSFANVRVLHAFNAGPFNKSWGLNLASRVANASWFFLADADLMIATDIEETLDVLARGVDVVKPYHRVIDLTQAQTDALDDGTLPLDLIESDAPADRRAIGEHLVLGGGVIAMQARTFTRIGGFDERFIGWGGDDDAITLKIQRVRPSVVALQGAALHLYHPRDQAALMGHAHYTQNVALLDEYRQLPDAPLMRMLEIQKQMAANWKKYSPVELPKV
jgi:predicted glycosyltransferase involved in capsule biosynthesis